MQIRSLMDPGKSLKPSEVRQEIASASGRLAPSDVMF